MKSILFAKRFIKLTQFSVFSTVLISCLLPMAATAAPIITNTFGAGSISVNTSKFPSGPTVVSKGLTISGGRNYGRAAFSPDKSYLDAPGAILFNFSLPVTGFGFDYEANNVPIVVSAFDAAGHLLETDSFTGVNDGRFPAGFAGITGYNDISSAKITTSLNHNSIFVGTVDFAEAAVPEPASWGMMLVGMGVIGFAARRRQNVRVKYA